MPGGGSGYFESLRVEKIVLRDCTYTLTWFNNDMQDCVSLAAVDDDVLRSNAAFQHAHFRMVSTATE